jgi:hypothetical protein
MLRDSQLSSFFIVALAICEFICDMITGQYGREGIIALHPAVSEFDSRHSSWISLCALSCFESQMTEVFGAKKGVDV